MHIYAFVPLDLKDGGREKWDEVGEYWAERLIGGLRKIAPNVTDENIIARHFMTPLDITRYNRSEEHTSELQSLMRISYAVFCLKKKIKKKQHNTTSNQTEQYNNTNNTY